MNETCPKTVYGSGWRGHACGRAAKYEHEGVMYCKTHHPPTAKAKQDARTAEWNAKVDRRIAASRAADAKAAEQQRRAECFPDLLEALQRIANNFDESWVAGCVERQMGDIARASIAKAQGEPS